MSEEQKPFYLIVFDPSLNSSGWAVFIVKDKPKILNFGHIPNHHFSTKQIGMKLANIEAELFRLRNMYYPHVVIKEELVTKTKDAMAGVNVSFESPILAKVHGIAEKVFCNLEIEDVHNKQFKLRFTGHGEASKEKVEAECKKYEKELQAKTEFKTPPFVFQTDDQSDAVGIGIDWLIRNGYLKNRRRDK